MTREQLSIYVGIGLALLIGSWLFLRTTPDLAMLQSPSEARAYLKEQIERNGAKSAYASFTKENAALPSEDQHFKAHLMGELLYESLGVEAIAVCDAQFSFGCYHGLFARAIAEGGEERIGTLNDACVRAFSPLGTGCQHGIGHGILEFTGQPHIIRALALCANTTQLVPLLGCTSGVFMEYHNPLGGEATGLAPQTRLFNTERPYEPCDIVDQPYQASCYYELGQWFYDHVSREQDSVDAFCGALTGEHRKHCYLGIGASLAVAVHYAPEQVVASCDTLMDTLSCRAGGSWMLYANPSARADAAAVCAYPTSTDTTECLVRADFTQGLDPH